MSRKNFILVIILSFFIIASCTSKESYYIDKEKKAIVSNEGAFHRVVVDGNGNEVTFENYGDVQQGNDIIYFNRINPGFLVAEGFGLNKNYALHLAEGAKYSVIIYNKDNQAVKAIYFKVDYKGAILMADN
jgi:hypothetical protein